MPPVRKQRLSAARRTDTPRVNSAFGVTCFGLIDRSTREVSSRFQTLLYVCHPRLVNGYGSSRGVGLQRLALRRRHLATPAIPAPATAMIHVGGSGETVVTGLICTVKESAVTPAPQVYV